MIRVNGYAIDAALSEEHSFNNEITTHSVEKGSPTTDHVLVLPDEALFDCVVSDTPIGDIARERESQQLVTAALIGRADADSINLTPSKHALAFLRALRASGEPCIVECSIGTLTNQMIKTFVVTQTAAGGRALRFKLGFAEMVIVENEQAIIKVALPRAALKQNVAAKPSKNPPDAPASAGDGKRVSILHKLLH
jgi:hypothetical protein